ncbi:hypothetical protein F4561_002372 [Lipingzhangella halophila]|uniref:PS-10 peptidase S37 n=1 Tax=Lipingzhangella halophila TaxID=1783352 RepID=A0A7W7RGN7_9ACTN|nr:S28 family serine protease [Lipingzhangella halophila]MBB4931552.1 hypothetical protein [Lipingzhangella halophila]
MLLPGTHAPESCRSGIVLFLTVTTLVLGKSPIWAEQRSAEDESEIVDRLSEVPGLTVVAENDAPEGFRHFVLEYEQPADHAAPGEQVFSQRLALLHRGLDRPTVLHTTGYDVVTEPFRSEPARLVDGNQVSTEQRFFGSSRPDPADWSDLDIRQAATDHHRLIRALGDIYEEEWISTGASKGGMTSVYHRRFYPGDLDGTVAYVAPNDADNQEDSAYLEFFGNVGTDPRCRQDLAALQRESLERRGDLVARYEERAAEQGWTFGGSLPSADAAFELIVLDTPWHFWQFQTQERCADIPDGDSSTTEIAEFLGDVYGWYRTHDEAIEPYVPYYYQAASQLGYPSVPTDHIDDLLEYPGLFRAASYLPEGVGTPEFDAEAMSDIDQWVRTRGERLLFVDGEFDPWGAESFRVQRGGERDSARFVAPRANHGADIEQLAPQDRAAATAMVRRWAGLKGVPGAPPGHVPELDNPGELARDAP